MPLGALESGHSAFVQDETGGIGLYLDAPVVSSLPAGTTIRVSGTLDTRFAQRVLRMTEAAIEVGPTGELPAAPDVATGSADESREGSRITIRGTVDGTPGALSDGLGLTVDDGSGPVKAVIGPEAIGPVAPTSGDLVVVRGPLGQRDSSGTGTEAYRVYAMLAGDFEILRAAGAHADAERLGHGDAEPDRHGHTVADGHTDANPQRYAERLADTSVAHARRHPCAATRDRRHGAWRRDRRGRTHRHPAAADDR